MSVCADLDVDALRHSRQIREIVVGQFQSDQTGVGHSICNEPLCVLDGCMGCIRVCVMGVCLMRLYMYTCVDVSMWVYERMTV